MKDISIDVIETISDFEMLRETWDQLFLNDRFATVFLSWPFIRGVIDTIPGRWRVLVLRWANQSRPIALLPLVDVKVFKCRIPVLRELHFGGSPSADYTGFLLDITAEEEALRVLSEYLCTHRGWDRIKLIDVADQRLNWFLAGFAKHKEYALHQEDGNVCPYIDLPQSWEGYCAAFLKSKLRYNLHRSIKQVSSLDNYRAIACQSDEFSEGLEIHLKLWRARWGHSEEKASIARSIFKRSFEDGIAWGKVIVSGSTPVASAMGFIDNKYNRYMLYSTAFNEEFSKLSPGRVVVALSIQDAISQGFAKYDFLRGDEEYKSWFGASRDYRNRDVSITRLSFRTLIGQRASKVPSIRNWLRRRVEDLATKSAETR